MTFTDITVQRDYRSARAGQALEGLRVQFTPTAPMNNAGDTVIPIPVTVDVPEDGQLQVVLAANTDPTTDPAGTGYHVRELLPRGSGGVSRGYIVIIPHDAPGGILDLSTLDEVNVPELSDFITQDELDALAVVVASKQPADADLAAFAALAPADDDVVQRKAGAWVARTPEQLAADLSLGDLGDVDTTGAVVGQVVAVAQASPLEFELIDSTEATAYAAGRRILAEYRARVGETARGLTVAAPVPSSTATTIASGVVVNAYDRTNAEVEPALRVLRGRAIQANANYPRYDYIRADPTAVTYAPGPLTGSKLWIEVEYNGAELDILSRQAAANGVASDFTVWVDGRIAYELTAAIAAGTGTAQGSLIRVPITFDDARRRLIAIEYKSPSTECAGFVREPAAAFTYPVSTGRGPRVVAAGDSYGEGTGATTPDRGYVALLPLMLGWPDTWNASSGSTGYVTDGARTSLVDRYQNDIIDQDPNIVIIALGLNDHVTYQSTPATVTAAATTVWDAIVDQLPDAELVVVGPWYPGDPTAAMVSMDAELRTLAEVRGLRYISPISEQWITGTGDAGTPAGDGNADVYISSDGTHPTGAGHLYLSWRLAGHLTVPMVPAIPA